MASNKLTTLVVAAVGIIIVMFYIYQLQETFTDINSKQEIFQAIRRFQISIWTGWILITGAAILLRWRNNNNILFVLDYLLGVSGFIYLGYYLNQGIENGVLSNAESFKEGVSYMVIKNILLISGMTAFIQGAIWWFSKKWPRR